MHENREKTKKSVKSVTISPEDLKTSDESNYVIDVPPLSPGRAPTPLDQLLGNAGATQYPTVMKKKLPDGLENYIQRVGRMRQGESPRTIFNLNPDSPRGEPQDPTSTSPPDLMALNANAWASMGLHEQVNSLGMLLPAYEKSESTAPMYTNPASPLNTARSRMSNGKLLAHDVIAEVIDQSDDLPGFIRDALGGGLPTDDMDSYQNAASSLIALTSPRALNSKDGGGLSPRSIAKLSPRSAVVKSENAHVSTENGQAPRVHHKPGKDIPADRVHQLQLDSNTDVWEGYICGENAVESGDNRRCSLVVEDDNAVESGDDNLVSTRKSISTNLVHMAVDGAVQRESSITTVGNAHPMKSNAQGRGDGATEPFQPSPMHTLVETGPEDGPRFTVFEDPNAPARDASVESENASPKQAIITPTPHLDEDPEVTRRREYEKVNEEVKKSLREANFEKKKSFVDQSLADKVQKQAEQRWNHIEEEERRIQEKEELDREAAIVEEKNVFLLKTIKFAPISLKFQIGFAQNLDFVLGMGACSILCRTCQRQTYRSLRQQQTHHRK